MTGLRSTLLAAIAFAAATPSFARAEAAKDDPRCAHYGSGFVYSESTGFCIRISGHVQIDTVFGDKGGIDKEVGVGFDARQNLGGQELRIVVEPKVN